MSGKEKAAVFAIGAAGYPLLELLYRKRTHCSMALAGGICFSLIYRIHKSRRSFLSRCLRGAAAITAVELATGLVVNKLMRLHVWDYSRARFNLLGQVCPRYTAIWFALTAAVAPLCGVLRRSLAERCAL